MPILAEFQNEIIAKRGGILKHIRPLLLPSPTQLRDDTHAAFLQDQALVNGNPDEQLCWLLEEEYRRYLRSESGVGRKFLIEMNIWTQDNPDVYPNLELLANHIASIPTQPEPLITQFSVELGMALQVLESSISQGRRSRAGGSLMEHLGFVLKQHGFSQGIDFQREVSVGGGQPVVLDFLFPAEPNYLQQNPNESVTCACMTTVNDRSRLAYQQLQPNTVRRIPTALGAIQFEGQLDNLNGQLSQIQKKGAKAVVLQNAVSHYNNNAPVISYTDWFKELNHLKRRWREIR